MFKFEKLNISIFILKMEQKPVCKALVQQGLRINLTCDRIPLENGYCIYHRRNYEYESLVALGKSICGMFFRGCNNELSETDLKVSYKNCSHCRAKKLGKQFNCKHQGCTFHTIHENEYCKKHIRQLLYETQRKENIIYCDIDRGCFNQVRSGIKCNSCVYKDKQHIASTIEILREKHTVVGISSPDTHLKTQQEEKTISIAELWRCVQKNAYIRGLLFTITESDFEKCVIQPCYYCGFYSTTRLNGIDRIDNNKGYVLANCLSCCTMCNVIKNTQHPIEFLDKVNAICNYYITREPNSSVIIEKWKSYLSSSPRSTYATYIVKSKEREIEFLLSEKEYTALIQGICYLCGITNLINHTNGIDRIDSRIRCYSIDNSKTCCGHCNTMKGILSYTDFIDKCIQINKQKCNRSIFEDISVYSVSKCRNEFYTADDIYKMMTNGMYINYIEWCKEKNKSSEFISAINHIHHTESTKEISIEQIRSELEKERSRHEELTDKKHIQSSTVYSYLTQGKIEYFTDWYKSLYNKTTLFDEQLDLLLTTLPTLTREKGIEACKKFMYDEKNRRISQERRNRGKKVIKYSSDPVPAKNEIIYPKSIDITHPIAEKVKLIQSQKGYIKVEAIKQWKSKQIFESIQENREHMYKAFCEENNTLDSSWEERWSTFTLSVKNKPFAESEPVIKSFVENLRRIRHNELCLKPDLVERPDRQMWPSNTVVRAFLEGKLDAFKTFTEAYTNEESQDPKWMKRWSQFTTDLESNRSDPNKLKHICGKFLTAQRTKKYRRS